LNSGKGDDEINWKFMAILFAVSFVISSLIHIIVCLTRSRKRNEIPPNRTMIVDRSQALNCDQLSSTDRIVDKNCEEMDVEVYPDGEVHLYDKASPKLMKSDQENLYDEINSTKK
jgi:hypothetical protein